MSEHSSNNFLQTDSFPGKLAEIVHNAASQFLIVVMTVVITLEVIFRYFLGAGFTWSQEVCSLCFLLLVFLCQAHTWQKDRHIRMNIFYNSFNPLLKKISNILTIICGSILYTCLAWQGLTDLQYQWEVNEATAELVWPLWPFSMVIVASSIVVILLLLRFTFIRFFRKAKVGV